MILTVSFEDRDYLYTIEMNKLLWILNKRYDTSLTIEDLESAIREELNGR